MCGIAGILHRDGKPVSETVLRKLGSEVAHRGRDSAGVVIEGGLGLISHRFALEDLPAGSQPSRHAGFIVVWNGEIFNWRELADRYAIKGATGDTTLLPRLLEAVGPAAFSQINGQFAIAAFESRSRTLLLARDPSGILPLYYRERDGALYFASEARALAALPGVRDRPDEQAASFFMRSGYFPTPMSPYDGLRQVEPGCVITFREGRVERSRFSRMRFTADYAGGPDEAAAELENLFREAVRRRLPLSSSSGLFLSGGVDSALIAGACKDLGESPPSFTVGFSADGPLAQYHFIGSLEKDQEVHNEFAEADATAAWMNLTVSEKIVVNPAEICRRFAEMVHCLDVPCMSVSALPLFFLTAHAAPSIKVALSGGGADELFAGYAHVDPGQYPEGRPTLDRYLELTEVFSPSELASIDSPLAKTAEDFGTYLSEQVADAAEGTSEGLPWILAAERLGPLACNILHKNDRIAMRLPLELRYPFLDSEVIHWAERLPARLLAVPGRGKLAVKGAARLLGVPGETVERKKVRLGAPYNTYLRNPAIASFFKSLIEKTPPLPLRAYDPQKAISLLFGVGSERVWRRAAKILLLATWSCWAQKASGTNISWRSDP